MVDGRVGGDGWDGGDRWDRSLPSPPSPPSPPSLEAFNIPWLLEPVFRRMRCEVVAGERAPEHGRRSYSGGAAGHQVVRGIADEHGHVRLDVESRQRVTDRCRVRLVFLDIVRPDQHVE